MPTKLPGDDAAIVDHQTLTGYCSKPDHPHGKHKARVFATLGFRHIDLEQPADAERLAAVLGRCATVRYTSPMTRPLDEAIAKLETLPPEEQDRVGRWLLDELRDEEHWTRQFGASQDVLNKLAAEARADRAVGRTTDLDPDKL